MKKIIIIGAGVSGLASGVYSALSGFETAIYEKNVKAGGLCMGWERHGVKIDGCIHWLTGTRGHNDINKGWREIGALKDDGSDVFIPESFGTYNYKNYKMEIYTDKKKFEQELLEISPDDKKEIKRFFRYVNEIFFMPLPMNRPLNTMDPFRLMRTGLELLPGVPTLLKLNSMSCEDYSKRFKHPALQFLFSHLPPIGSTAYAMIYTYATLAYQNGGIPKKGSLEFVNRIVDKYKRLGGELHLGQGVDEILIDNRGKAYGIRLENGGVVFADYIISSCDAYETLKYLLKGKYHNSHLDKRFCDELRYPSPSCFMLIYKVKADLINKVMPTNAYYFLGDKINIGNTIHDDYMLRHYGYDEYFINKDGYTTINVLFDQKNVDYSYWEKIYPNKKAYKEEKERLNQKTLENIYRQLPELKDQLTLVDSFSPKTLNRYTNAYKGSYMPFMLLNNNRILLHNGHIRGLKNLYISGQWTQTPGGLPLALASGKFAVQRICKKEAFHFKFSKRTKTA